MKIIIIYIGALIMGYISCLNSSLAQAKPISDSERIGLRNLFLDCMDSVIKKTNDSEAKQVADFVRKNNVAGSPHPHGVRYLEGAGTNKNWFVIIPFYKQDAQLSDYWNSLVISRSSAAKFVPKNRALLINATYAMSNVWKGITMIHEGWHAYTFITNPYQSQTDDEYASEEVKAHIIQNRIMSELGGKKYAELLTKEATRLKNKIVAAGLNLGVDFPMKDRNYPELDQFFGKSKSNFETEYRGSSFWIQAIFKLIDDEFRNGSEIKVNFLKAIYKDGGII